MNSITQAQWLETLTKCGVRATTAVRWSKAFAAVVQPSSFNLGKREINDFVGQMLHETAMLERVVENLNYTAQRMTEVWPGRFPTIESAERYAKNPEALAEKVYGGRLGNTEPGDGWNYRGRGIPMITGKENYALVEKLSGEPLVDYPVLLENPEIALKCGLLWWERKIPDSAIDSVERTTRIVQGGQLALEERRRLTDLAGEALA